MTEENDGFNLEDDNFDNFENKKGTLGAMWRDKPMFKVGVVVGAAILIFGTIILFGGGDAEPPPVSMAPSGSTVSAPPGTQEASPAYIEAVKEQNESNVEQAQREGGSALPTPIEPPVGIVAVPEEAAAQEDPLQRWRKLQEERLQRELQRSQTLTPEVLPQEAAARAEEINNMAQTMAQQMQAILESRNRVKMTHINVTDQSYLDQLKQEEVQAAQIAAAQTNQATTVREIIFPAGEIAYAQLITEANSDAPGPVLAQIAGGPLNGARILGDFDVRDELLTLHFNTIVLEGISYNIDAIALDPKTTLPAMATDVDHHYLQRIVLPMAAAFVEGMANAISESGRTNITVTGETVATETDEASNDQQVASGIEEAGQELGDILDDMADDVEVTVRIESGTRMGVLFLEPVVKRGNEAIYNPNKTVQEVVNANAGQ